MVNVLRQKGADAAAMALLCVIFVVGAGWVFDVGALKSFVPGRTAMKVPASVMFVLLAAAILLVRHTSRPRWKNVALGLCGIVAVFSVIVVVTYVTGAEMRIERRLAAETPRALETLDAGRMAPNAAVSFVLLVIALWLLPSASRRSQRIASLLLYAVGFSSFLVVLGYLYGVQDLREIGSYTPMSLPAAVCFLLATAAIALLCPDRGFCSLILDDSLAGSVSRTLLPAAIFIPVLIGWLRLVGERRELFGVAFGTALMVIAYTVLIGTLIWITARMLQRVDAQRSAAEEQLRALTITDPLTGLFNRRGLMQLADAELQLAQRNRLGVVVIYIDVDAFKAVNDTFGHREGDQVLQTIAHLLRTTCCDADIISRIGGDEFCIFSVSAPGGASGTIQRLRAALDAENDSRQRPFAISFSIGCATARPAERVSIEDLLKHADADMFRSRGRQLVGDVDATRSRDDDGTISAGPPRGFTRGADRVALSQPLHGTLPAVGVVSVLDISSTGARIRSARKIEAHDDSTIEILHAQTGKYATIAYRIVWQRSDSRFGHDTGIEWESASAATDLIAAIRAAKRSDGTSVERSGYRFRMPNAVPAAFTAGDVAILDMSLSGMRITSNAALEPNSTGTLSLGPDGGPAVNVSVVWSRATRSTSSSGHTYEAGLRLVDREFAAEWVAAAVVASQGAARADRSDA